MILGIDEVGRGPWAGPIVVGAVILGCEIEEITDSKKLTAKKREKLALQIKERALATALGWVYSSEIDTLGLAPALELACKRAIESIDTLGVAYHEIIIDGTVNLLKSTPKGKFVATMKKADLLVPSVGAASIVAKVARDTYMKEQSKLYPEYGFSAHVGYGTAVHRAAIEQYGVTPLHRLSFAPLRKYRTGAAPSVHAEKDAPTPPESRLEVSTKHIGDIAESVVAEHLEGLGHTIRERNWRTKMCEIDIVSQKGDTMFFVEVKYRKNTSVGDGLAAITKTKLKQMQFAVKMYAYSHPSLKANLRLVAVSVSGQPPHVDELIEIL